MDRLRSHVCVSGRQLCILCFAWSYDTLGCWRMTRDIRQELCSTNEDLSRVVLLEGKDGLVIKHIRNMQL